MTHSASEIAKSLFPQRETKNRLKGNAYSFEVRVGKGIKLAVIDRNQSPFGGDPVPEEKLLDKLYTICEIHKNRVNQKFRQGPLVEASAIQTLISYIGTDPKALRVQLRLNDPFETVLKDIEFDGELNTIPYDHHPKAPQPITRPDPYPLIENYIAVPRGKVMQIDITGALLTVTMVGLTLPETLDCWEKKEPAWRITLGGLDERIIKIQTSSS